MLQQEKPSRLTPLARPLRKVPLGWQPFGTHADLDVKLDFSHDTDSAGVPLWERLAVVNGCPTCGRERCLTNKAGGLLGH